MVSPRVQHRVERQATDPTSVDRLIFRIRREFEEMPGLRLTLAQAARLFGTPAESCGRVLARLESDGVLRQTAKGQWVGRKAGG